MQKQASNTEHKPIEGRDPFALFAAWFAEAEKSEPNDPNAMNLATLGGDGRISNRILLLKSFDTDGFCFFTNTLSRKGKQLKEKPVAAMCFHWKSLRRQVRIEGAIQPVTDKEADEYFQSRPRGSQIGAWASKQSDDLDARKTLEDRVKEFERKYEGQTVPRPPHWSGYRLHPDMIEFWQDMPFRLHDRVVFTRAAQGWAQRRIYP